jgi:WD40 repeat protein
VIKLWDPATGTARATIDKHLGTVQAVAFSPDGQTLASGDGFEDSTVRLWDVRTCVQRDVFEIAHSIHDWVCAKVVVFSADGNTLAVSVSRANGDHDLPGEVILWNGRLLQKFENLLAFPPAVAFTPDGNFLAISSEQGVRLIELATGQERAILRREGSGGLLNFGISSDGKTLVSVDVSTRPPREFRQEFRQTVVLWDLTSYQPTAIITLPQHVGACYLVAFSHDGTILATSGQDGYIRLWALPAGKELTRIKRPNGTIFAVCFSPDDKMIAYACSNGAVVLADVK